MGAGHLSSALAVFVALGSLPQTQDEATLREARAHAATVQQERSERLLALYAAADADARQRAEGVLERLHSPGAGLVSPPAMRAVDQAARALEPGTATGWLQELADSLDLRVLPGMFEARTSGRTPLTVIVEPLYAVSGVKDVELTLLWLAPDGAEQRARTEPVAVAAFQPPGFDMFITAPLGPPAAWRLVAEVAQGEQRARGIPVVVEGLADLQLRFESISAPPEVGTPAALYKSALASSVQRGVRRLVGLGSGEVLARLEPRAAPAGPEPLALAFHDEDGAEHWVWALDPPAEHAGEPPAQLVILLAPRHEAPEAALARPAWRDYARTQRARVLSTQLPDSAGTAALLLELRRHAEGAPTLVVARGGALGALLLGMMGREELPFDAAVFSTVVEDTSTGSILPQVPRLLVAPGGNASLEAARAASPEPAARCLWVTGARAPLLNEPALPDLCARFVASELASGRGR